MTLDDPRGCPGHMLHIHGRTAAMCLCCDRLDCGGPQMDPQAVRLPGGLMYCDARLNVGGHAQIVADDAADHQPLPRGGVCTASTTNAGVPR